MAPYTIHALYRISDMPLRGSWSRLLPGHRLCTSDYCWRSQRGLPAVRGHCCLRSFFMDVRSLAITGASLSTLLEAWTIGALFGPFGPLAVSPATAVYPAHFVTLPLGVDLAYRAELECFF